jgi:hypothetical protein
MVPLLRVTDMRYEQSLPGRLLNYGDFVIEGMGFLSRIRRVRSLPGPNELYLRIVEEMYEPEAVEARLAPRSETLTEVVREAIYGPALSNYDGWISIEVLDAYDNEVTIGRDRSVSLEPGSDYVLGVTIGPSPVTEVSEVLTVTGGVDRAVVEFTAEVDSDQRALRQSARTIEAGPDGGYAAFPIRMPAAGFAEPPWLWVRVSQEHRLLQSVELTASVRVALE